jgi:predicted transport protein
LQIWTKVDPSSLELEEGFTRDVTHIGHLGTGNLEIRIQTPSDLEKAKPLLSRSYHEN